MTTISPGPRSEAPSRADALALAAALLVAVSGLFALPADLFRSPVYYTDSWTLAAAVARASVLTTLTLGAAAVARGSRILLLVAGGVAVLHLAGLVGLALTASVRPEDADRFWIGAAKLGVALVCLALAWWITRTERRPLAPLLLLSLAPVLDIYFGMGTYVDPSLWPLVVALFVPLVLTILAAGLVCLPGRGQRIAGAVLIVLGGLGLHGRDLLLGDEPPPYRLAVMGLALVCAVAGIITWRSREPAAGTLAHLGPEAGGPPDDKMPAAPDTDAEVTMSDTAVVVVPSTHPEAGRDTTGDPAATSGRTTALPVAALVVLVLTAALRVPEIFAHGPGIQPAGLGLESLLGALSRASMPAVFILTAGAATLASRAMLVVASTWSGLLVIVLLVSWTEVGWAVAPPGPLSYAALGVALALAWTGRTRPGSGGVALRWAAVAPLVLASLPLSMLIYPGAMAFISALEFLTGILVPDLLLFVAPVVAAALLGRPRRSAYVAAAVLAGVVALATVGVTLIEASGPRLLTALNVLQIGGHALACVLVLAALLTPGRPSTPGPTSARSVWAG